MCVQQRSQKEAVFVQQGIAILDSGVGGLTVVKEVMRQLPMEKLIYIGDTARAPYGPRSPEEVKNFTAQVVQYLIQFDPKMIVIACNTATAAALDFIRDMVSIPVIGVIFPGARAAIKRTRTKTIGVIGTEGTIRSGAYHKALLRTVRNLNVYSLACPEFVPLVEQGLFSGDHAMEIVNRSLQPLKEKSLDCLILGCTHYPFLQPLIAEAMGADVALISSAEETAREISAILHEKGKLAKTLAPPCHEFYCTHNPQMFRNIAARWLDEEISVASVLWGTAKLA